MEVQGLLMRGSFEKPATTEDHDIEWCERRILQRIHKLTIGIRRRKRLSLSRRRHSCGGCCAGSTWPRKHNWPVKKDCWKRSRSWRGSRRRPSSGSERCLPARVAEYNPAWLDRLCLSGAVGWGRVSPHPAFAAGDGSGPRRVIPSNAAPITFYVRDSAEWLVAALEEQSVDERKLNQALTPEALRAWELLKARGACFIEDVQRLLVLTRQQAQIALWELAAAGLAAADGFDQLRAMIDPERKPAVVATHRKMRSAAGRWSLFSADIPAAADALEKARRADAAVESAARMLLARYGVVFRDLVARESNIPRWGALLRMLRRLEDRGEVRGGPIRERIRRRAVRVARGCREPARVAAPRFRGDSHSGGSRSHESRRHSYSGRARARRRRGDRSCFAMAWWRKATRSIARCGWCGRSGKGQSYRKLQRSPSPSLRDRCPCSNRKRRCPSYAGHERSLRAGHPVVRPLMETLEWAPEERKGATLPCATSFLPVCA